MEYKDYYQIIEADPSANSDDIERAYRTLARKYHPDINPDNPEILQRFRDITEAHTVLISRHKRAKYNEMRAMWLAHPHDSAPFDWSAWVIPTNGHSRPNQGEFSEFFETIFADESFVPSEPVVSRHEPVIAKSAPISEPIAEKSIPVDEPVIAKSAEVAPKTKKYEYVQPFEITIEECFKGASKVLKLGEQQLMVKVPRGAKNGTRIRVVGKQVALPLPDGTIGPEGDLFLEIKFAPHPLFEAMGDDLQAELPLNLYTAMLGGEATVPNLSKGVIKLKIPPETQPGRVFRLKGLGLPRLQQPDERGDLLVKVTVTLPQNLTPDEIALFEELADLRGL